MSRFQLDSRLELAGGVNSSHMLNAIMVGLHLLIGTFLTDNVVENRNTCVIPFTTRAITIHRRSSPRSFLDRRLKQHILS